MGLKFRTIFDQAGYRSSQQSILLLEPQNTSVNELTPEVKGICQ
ncbi:MULTISPECIES: hypothetical protein [Vibrio]|nr:MULTISPECIES: hypothetical protein [Vibrio]